LSGFVYDGTEVKPLATGQEEGDSDQTVNLPLQVRGEAIGHLSLAGVNDVDEETQVLLTAVAQQLSGHIEGLRLSAQTQVALAQTNKQAQRLALLNEFTKTISRLETVDDIVTELMQKAPEMIDARRISLHLIDEADPTMLRVVGIFGEVADIDIEERLPLEDSPMADALAQRQLVSGFFDVDEEKLQAYFAPLYASERPLGTFNIAVSVDKKLQDGDRQILLQIASILGTTLENRTLFNQTRSRADREQLVNKITQKIQIVGI